MNTSFCFRASTYDTKQLTDLILDPLIDILCFVLILALYGMATRYIENISHNGKLP